MKILFIDQFSEMGGAQRVLIDTIDAVQARGWRAHVALPPGGVLIGSPSHEKHRGQLRFHADLIGRGRSPYADIVRFAFDLRRQVRALDALMARTHFDLVYVNGPRVLAGASLANGGRAPMLFHCTTRFTN